MSAAAAMAPPTDRIKIYHQPRLLAGFFFFAGTIAYKQTAPSYDKRVYCLKMVFADN